MVIVFANFHGINFLFTANQSDHHRVTEQRWEEI